jgi:hypothetical protein
MQPTNRAGFPKPAGAFALLILAAFLLSAIAVSAAAQAAPQASSTVPAKPAPPTDGHQADIADSSLLLANVAPNEPALVQPDEHATGVSAAPTLGVAVSDPDPGDTLSASFYGRVAGETPEDFTLVVIPDAQNYATLFPQSYIDMLQWIASNKTAMNVSFVAAVGDLVNIANSTAEWDRADAAFDTLDAAHVRYSVAPGNHDLGIGMGLPSLYDDYFGSARFAGKPWYGGHYGSNNYNNYALFSASGMDFIVISLEYDVTAAQLDWADGLLKAYPDRRGILVKHRLLNLDNTWGDYVSYLALKDNPNLFLMLCGHMHNGPDDGAAYDLAYGDDGHPIHVVLANYQDFLNSGYLRILRFSPADDMIYMTTYSSLSDSYLTSTTNYDQADLGYDMPAGPPFELIGTSAGVPNGGTASVDWQGLNPGGEFEWYATASDGSLSTTGPTWTFTTAAAPKAPVVTSIAQSGSDVELGWDAVTLDVLERPTEIIEYRVYVSQEPYFTLGTLLTPPSSTQAFTHTGGSAGATNWYYLVRAFNVIGESANSDRRVGRFAFALAPGTAP